jgi:hypothetical protein
LRPRNGVLDRIRKNLKRQRTKIFGTASEQALPIERHFDYQFEKGRAKALPFFVFRVTPGDFAKIKGGLVSFLLGIESRPVGGMRVV